MYVTLPQSFMFSWQMWIETVWWWWWAKNKKNKLIFPTSVISFAFATGFLSDAALLWVVHHFLPCLAALGRWREELCEGVDEALGLVVEAQAAVWQVAVLPHGKKQPVVSGVTFAGGAGGRVCWGRALPPTAPSQLLKGPPRPAEDKSVRVKVTIAHTLYSLCSAKTT